MKALTAEDDRPVRHGSFGGNLDRGRRAIDRCDSLAKPPFSQSSEGLTRPYLTDAHKQTVLAVRAWMEAAGMSTRLDPLASLVGRYEADRDRAPTLMIGSHIDSVANAGHYDGALGVMIGIEVVAALFGAGRRFPFAIEIVAFGDEEGSRFPASMQCSAGMARGLDPQAMEMRDAAGVTLHRALSAFGLDPLQASTVARAKGSILGYVEAHIEQGPVLESEGAALGVVTGIAAQLRLAARFRGTAGHAGTTPMGLRRDPIAAAADAILAVERVCRAGPAHLRGTVGRIIPDSTAFNVIAGTVEIGIDIRAATAQARDVAAAQIMACLREIAAERGVELGLEVVQDLAAAPCDPALAALLKKAVEETGERSLLLMSGAGHDAMMMRALCPMVMLFIRCKGGVSHHPTESVAPADVGKAITALSRFLELVTVRGLPEAA